MGAEGKSSPSSLQIASCWRRRQGLSVPKFPFKTKRKGNFSQNFLIGTKKDLELKSSLKNGYVESPKNLIGLSTGLYVGFNRFLLPGDTLNANFNIRDFKLEAPESCAISLQA